MKFVDKAPLLGTRRTSDGYLVAEIKIARTGIQDYAGYEVGKPSMSIVKVYRPEDQVFNKDSMKSYAHKPVTNDHPDEEVSSNNWKDLAVGQIGDPIARDGDFVRAPIIVMDSAVIEAVESGKREVSAGYTCDLAFEPGITPDGQHYDAVQRNIHINHVAIVSRGRAGKEARIGDDAKNWGISPFPLIDNEVTQMTMTTIVLGDKAVQVLEKDAPVVDAFKKEILATNTQLTADFDTQLAQKDAEIAKKDAQIAELSEKVLDGVAMDAAVQARADLIQNAKAICPDVVTSGLSDADIRKAVVVKRFGDEMNTRSQSYIDARFDVLVEDAASTDQLSKAITTVKPNDGRQMQNDAHAAYAKRLQRGTRA